MGTLAFDVAHLFAGGLVLISFMLLYQDRMTGLINIFALHAVVLSLSVAWQAYVQHSPHLFLTAAIAIIFKATIIPLSLQRIMVRLRIHRDIEVVGGVGVTMLLGICLVALSLVVILPATAAADPLAREDVAFALSVVLLGLLMMVTRRNAISQVIGFMSLENGLILAATGAKGMPLVVEISVAFSVLIAFIVIGIFLFGSASVSTPSMSRSSIVFAEAVDEWLRRPARRRAADYPGAVGAHSRVSVRLSPDVAHQPHFVRRGLSFAVALLFSRPAADNYLFVDDLNVVFVVLSTFIGSRRAPTARAISVTKSRWEN